MTATTITLTPELAEQIEHLGGTDQESVQQIVERAVRAYLARLRQEKIRREAEAFQAQYRALLADYAGQYVALHQGRVIDNDPDLRTLHLRVFEKVGHTPVLLKQVTAEPELELVFRSPRLDRRMGG